MSQRKSSALVTCFYKNYSVSAFYVCFLVFQSSGSGSESGIHNKMSVKTESTEGSESEASMSDEDHENENGSNGLSNRDGGSDNGSGTQVNCFMAIDNNNV